MRTSNPMLRASTFDARAEAGVSQMTILGTVHKTALLVLIVFAAATWSWNRLATEGGEAMYPWMIGSSIGGLVLGLVTCFRQTIAHITSPLYAACEGVFLGAVSALLDTMYPGIAIQAVGLTTTTLLALLIAYRSGLIRATENFKLGMAAAMGALLLFYLVTFALRMFGVDMPFLHDGGLLSIGISMGIVILAALNLVLDFDFIEQGEAKGAPKHMEWYAAFGLLVTLVWLYLETLRLLAKLQSRD
jgi:uncharacterized YccA/Bax inhibitor family protein